MGAGDGYQWGQSKWKGSQSGWPHSSFGHGADDSKTQKSGWSAGSKGPRAGCRSGSVVIVGKEEQPMASRDSATSAKHSWAVAKLCSPCFG